MVPNIVCCRPCGAKNAENRDIYKIFSSLGLLYPPHVSIEAKFGVMELTQGVLYHVKFCLAFYRLRWGKP